MGSLQSNIWKLRTIKGLRSFLLIMPIIVLFFQENGLSLQDIFVLQAIFSVAVVLFEIPSGYFSDIMGRKITIIYACLLSFIGFCVYSISSSFTGLLTAELLLGLGASFLSGTDSAMLYDTLIQLKRKKEYKKLEGRMGAITNFSEGIASILGGLLALISLRVPFYVETALVLLTIPLALTLVEPKRKKLVTHGGHVKEILRIVHYSLHGHKEVKWLILYAGLVGASTLTAVWFLQPYFNQVNLPLAYFGIVWALGNLSVGLFAWYAHSYEEKIGRTLSLVSLILLSCAGYFILSSFSSLWILPFALLFYFVRGINAPILNDYINQHISSDMRATVLSVKGLVLRLIFVILGPFAGWVADIYSLQTALLVSGGIFLSGGILCLLYLHKHKAL